MPAAATPRRRSARLSATPEPTPAPSARKKASRSGRKALDDVSEGDSVDDVVEVEAPAPAPAPTPRRRPRRSSVVLSTVESVETGSSSNAHASSNSATERALKAPANGSQASAPLQITPAQQKASRLVQRKRRLWARLRFERLISVLAPLLILAGYLLPLTLPLPPPAPDYYRNGSNGISKGTYVDENALQPGQAWTHFNHETDVLFADDVAHAIASIGISGEVTEDRAALDKSQLGAMTAQQRDYLVDKMASLGLKPMVQEYEYKVGAEPAGPARRRRRADVDGSAEHALHGANVFAHYASPRTDAREAFVICAPWLSSWDGQEPADPDHSVGGGAAPVQGKRRVNVRGVATVLALARFLTTQGYIARDLIFVISDGHLAGMQAFLSSYYATNQSNLETSLLSFSDSVRHELGGSVIWNALAIDYPSDSFKALELLHEGLDGQLPNMDVLNTVTEVARSTGSVPVRIPGLSRRGPARYVLESTRSLAGNFKRSAEEMLKRPLWEQRQEDEYVEASEALLRQIGLQSIGRTTGVHGLFTRYHIDAVTIRAVPATGPYGFLQMGRIAEGSIRSYNNLLERLHHSQFFYLLLSPHRFVPFGVYIPANLLISIGLTFLALRAWTRLGRTAHTRTVELFEMHRSKLLFANAETTRRSVGDVQVERPPPEHLVRDLLRIATQHEDVKVTFEPSAIAAQLDAQARPIAPVLAVMAACHVAGFVGLRLLARTAEGCTKQGLLTCEPIRAALSVQVTVLLLGATLLSRRVNPAVRKEVGSLLHTFAALHAGMLIAVGSVLNFSQALVTALFFGIPLALGMRQTKLGRARALITLLANSAMIPLIGLILVEQALQHAPALARYAPALGRLDTASAVGELRREVERVLWEWRVVRSVFVPYAMVGVLPIALEAAIAASLDLCA